MGDGEQIWINGSLTRKPFAEALTMSERSLPVSLKSLFLAGLSETLCQARLVPAKASVHLGA